MMQIKIAQGAKPGEGGQLPGHKVDAIIAKIRHSTPGVGLISPPPHHDIYSIEDLAQLIFDLKNVNPAADVSVKLVSEVGVGTVAAGVAKARADHITISGYDGGTGASPLTSLKHAGSPWEMGLAETQQTLVLNGLRSRVALQVDGGLRTGRDVIIGALLGADEFGFSTAPLIAAGCIMMRKCHLNTCPVGVATQDPVLRKRFKGRPSTSSTTSSSSPRKCASCMAAMGFTQLRGPDRRKPSCWTSATMIDHWKAKGLDFSGIFHKPEADRAQMHHWTERQKHPDRRRARPQADRRGEARDRNRRAGADRNADRQRRPLGRRDAVGRGCASATAMSGLPDDTIAVSLHGHGGQSFGAFLARACPSTSWATATTMSARACRAGASSCGRRKMRGSWREESIIVGNTVLYGAIAGECYFRGVAGERFAVRNSGAIAVVEGVGDHGCEYMTGGIVVVIGQTGPQLRGRHVRRHRLCAGRGRAILPSAATWRWSSSSRCRKRTTCSRSCTTMAATLPTRAASMFPPT